MDCCTNAKLFFTFLEQIYVYFTSSTERYGLLTKALQSASTPEKKLTVPKRVSTTRWSSRADATTCLYNGYQEIKNILEELSEHDNQAYGLYKQMCDLETGIFTAVWNEILNRVNSVNVKIQDPNIDINTSIELMRSLQTYIANLRDSFEKYERLGMELSKNSGYRVEHTRHRTRNVRLNPLDYGNAAEAILSNSEKYRTDSFLPVIDQLLSSLSHRICAYEKVDNLFSFIRKLEDLSSEEIIKHADNLVKFYENDIDESLGFELIQFKEFCKLNNAEEKKLTISKLLIEKDVTNCFPNVETCLKIYLVVMSTNASGERSFSSLKLLKNEKRTSMTQKRLNNLSILYMESDILRELDHSELINDFAAKKSRKVYI